MKSLKDRIRDVVSEAKETGVVVDARRTAEVLAWTADRPARVGAIAGAVIDEALRQRAAVEVPPTQRSRREEDKASAA